MADEDKSQKTEEPTEKRKTEAHNKGEFAKSQDMGVTFSLFAGVVALTLTVGSSSREISDFATSVFANLHAVQFDGAEIPLPLWGVGKVVLIVLAPILFASGVAALLSGGLQSGFQLTLEVIGVKPEKLNPMAGVKRLFSERAAVMTATDFLKMIAVGLCLWLAARQLLGDPIFTTPVEAAYLGTFMKESTLALLVRMLLIMSVITALTYSYERYKTHRDQKMTRQEVKDERKQTEGNAQVKLALRRMARRLLQRQMLEAVPTADVVVTNPTHYAVALKYERGRDEAPVILAMGENALARRIKALAAEHEVPMVENRPVARMLYSTGKVGAPVPAELYEAVATILAFVYRTYRYYFHRLPARRLETGANA
jgi:flagellar biosynthesis protein FlhB